MAAGEVPVVVEQVEVAAETVAPRLGEVVLGEVAEVGEVGLAGVQVASGAEVVAQPFAQSEAQGLVESAFEAPVVAAAAYHARDALAQLDAQGGEGGVEVFLAEAVHPVVLLGREAQADEWLEVVGVL